MARKNLSVDQISKIENESPLKKLAKLQDVCGIVEFLCSQSNTGITGQFVSADTGFTNARIL
jgi:enoyl-[acyl-carrier-protein] reductase (NADH)